MDFGTNGHCFLVHYPTAFSNIDRVLSTLVLYGYETWSLLLREERRLTVFENRVLRRIFGPKRDEVTGEWRKLHNIVRVIK
jgi:hypothetical protein